MTNFDVIEAYTEDFTKWAYRNYRGTAKITNNTIVITNVVETNNIVEDDNEPYSDLTIRVTGVTENKYLIVRQGRGKPETYIKKMVFTPLKIIISILVLVLVLSVNVISLLSNFLLLF